MIGSGNHMVDDLDYHPDSPTQGRDEPEPVLYRYKCPNCAYSYDRDFKMKAKFLRCKECKTLGLERYKVKSDGTEIEK